MRTVAAVCFGVKLDLKNVAVTNAGRFSDGGKPLHEEGYYSGVCRKSSGQRHGPLSRHNSNCRDVKPPSS